METRSFEYCFQGLKKFGGIALFCPGCVYFEVWVTFRDKICALYWKSSCVLKKHNCYYPPQISPPQWWYTTSIQQTCYLLRKEFKKREEKHWECYSSPLQMTNGWTLNGRYPQNSVPNVYITNVGDKTTNKLSTECRATETMQQTAKHLTSLHLFGQF